MIFSSNFTMWPVDCMTTRINIKYGKKNNSNTSG